MTLSRLQLWLVLAALFFAAPFAGTAMAYWLVFLSLVLILAGLVAGHRPWRDRSALSTAFLAVFGLFYNWVRRRRFAR